MAWKKWKTHGMGTYTSYFYTLLEEGSASSNLLISFFSICHGLLHAFYSKIYHRPLTNKALRRRHTTSTSFQPHYLLLLAASADKDRASFSWSELADIVFQHIWGDFLFSIECDVLFGLHAWTGWHHGGLTLQDCSWEASLSVLL